MTAPLLIAVDCDGVLLDYNRAFGGVWMRHFQVALTPAEPRAYHATAFWGVERPPKDHPFWAQFAAECWRHMPAIPGALEACRRLADAGHRLVCVTSMPQEHRADREANLRDLGFPLEAVVATGSCDHDKTKTHNPKLAAITQLAPDWMVDDELRKLKDLPGVRCVLVDPGHPDSPNVNQDDGYLALRVESLTGFAEALLGPAVKPQRTKVGP